MTERTIIVGLTVREAEHEWRRLMDEQPEKYVGRRVKIASPVEAVRCLEGLKLTMVEVIVMDRVGRHPDAGKVYDVMRRLRLRYPKAGE